MRQTANRVRSFTIEGYFNEDQCKALKAALEGRTYHNYKISYSRSACNCTLIVETDYPHGRLSDIKKSFFWLALSELAERPTAPALTLEEVQLVLRTLTDGEPAQGFEIKPQESKGAPLFRARAFVTYSDNNKRLNELYFRLATWPGKSDYFDGCTRLRFGCSSSAPLYHVGGRQYVDQQNNPYTI